MKLSVFPREENDLIILNDKFQYLVSLNLNMVDLLMFNEN